MLKKYKLLKDLPWYKAGQVFVEEQDGYYYALGHLFRFQFTEGDMAYVQWFKEIPEEEVHPYRPFVPKEGEEYCRVDSSGDVFSSLNDNQEFNLNHIKQGVFRSREAAKYEALRREARAQAWWPKEDEIYRFDFGHKREKENIIQTVCISSGLAAPTEEEAQELWEKYGKAFEVLN